MATFMVRPSIFRDTDQTSRVLSILNEQRATSRFCDVILKVRDDHIYAHSNVLAAASPYFGSFLGLGPDQPRAFCEKTPQVIEIQIDGADATSGYGDAVRHVVEYMYTCTLELNSVIITQIVEIARIMQIQRVLDYCDRFLKGELGAQPLDKRTSTPSSLPDYAPSKRVKKANASTETELVMFQKSSGLCIEKLPQEVLLSASVSEQDADVKNKDLAEGKCVCDELEPDLGDPENELKNVIDNDCPVPTDKATQLDSDSLPDSQEMKPIEAVRQGEGSVVLIKNEDGTVLLKNEDGTVTGNVMIPFVNVPIVDSEIDPETEIPVLSKDEPADPGAVLQQSLVNTAGFFATDTDTPSKPKVTPSRGRKRGRPGNRGRGRRRKVREVLSDSDPELIQEPDDEALDVLSPTKPSETETSIADAENSEMKSAGELIGKDPSESLSSQEMPATSASATDSTISTVSGEGCVKEEMVSTEGGVKVESASIKEEQPETLSRTRGRKPITSVMASWTSPRRRAGIPRSVFRSDYVMHSLIRRRRQSSALESESLKDDEKSFDESERGSMGVYEALSKTVNEASAGIESSIKFVCQTCDFTTASFRFYRQHMKRHPETDTRSYTCTECNFHTTKARQLLQHRKRHLHEDLICSYCESQFDTKENFETHLLRHAHILPYFCHACDMRFKTRTQLTTHLPKHRTEKPFVCQICGNGFKWKHALKSHMVTHSATKDHLCDICGFATAHKSQLKAHRLIHTGDTFKCPEPGCSFEATKRQNLKYHMVTHTQEKAHQCEVCGQAFSLIKNMRRHMLLHNDTRPFHCSVCTYTTTRYDKLKEHKLKQHGIGQPPGKKMKFGDARHMAAGTLTVADDGTVVRSVSDVEGLQMVDMMEPITIAQGDSNITIRSEVQLTEEALQTIAQLAKSSTDSVAQGSQLQEAQINIATSEGIPIIARLQFTSSSDPDVVSYVEQVQE
ncbi:uncharacterized protein LOC143285533 [Babylonia areolata]|uniref:uncharacterized protein LOC143285533 n=1 Tax=Babylonia areolata TaxID=304850 RepID=UPI003FD433AB